MGGTEKPFLYEVARGVATITLNRPDRLNALTFEVYAALRDTVGAMAQDHAVRALVITGAGRGFCSGGDVEDIISKLLGRPAAELREFTEMTGAVVRNLRTLPVPAIAAVNGACVGAGAVIALACDVRIAAETAKFGFVFPQVGLSGADMGAAYLLPRVVGHGRAMELLLTGDIIDAREAHRIGLANRVVAVDQVVPEATALANRLAKGPRRAHAVTKEMVDREWAMSFPEAIVAESDVQADLMARPDFREAYEARRDKREPKFE